MIYYLPQREVSRSQKNLSWKVYFCNALFAKKIGTTAILGREIKN